LRFSAILLFQITPTLHNISHYNTSK
jgi:hypothetical protein